MNHFEGEAWHSHQVSMFIAILLLFASNRQRILGVKEQVVWSVDANYATMSSPD